ncbi:MAG: hypothetical protein JSR44_11325 [Spirochaetes bacterium]|nr:hypothetical protein [Spirochaetota bacterium]
MLKKITTLTAACLLVGSLSAAKNKNVATAPVSAAEGFQKGALFLGGAVGLGSGLGYLGGYTLMANAEYAVTNDIGIGGSIGYWGYSSSQNYNGCPGYSCGGSSYTVTYSYSIIPIVVSGAWHFHIGNPKWDLAAGVSAGYYIVNASTSVSNSAYANAGFSSASASGIAIGIFGQARYFLNDRIALHGRLGYGITFLEVGVDFKI